MKTNTLTLIMIAIIIAVYLSPSISSAASLASESWMITAVTGATTSSRLQSTIAPPTVVFRPSSNETVFLLVRFELNTTIEATPLNVSDILLLVDGAFPYIPSGLSSTATLSSSYAYVGTFTGSMNSTQLSYQVRAEYTDGTPVSFFGTITFGAAKPIGVFIYAVPRASLDGSHNLQLRIAGTTNVVTFTVEPPAIPELFPTWIILTLLATAAFVGTMILKKQNYLKPVHG